MLNFFAQKRTTQILSENQAFPDSQKEPLGRNQMAWLKERITSKHFRDRESGSFIKIGERPNEVKT